MWKDKLLEIIQEKNLYGEKINVGATEEEIQSFITVVKDEFNVDLPEQYIKVLEVVNGVEFNGFILYGIDQKLLSNKSNQPVNGLIENNKIWHENECNKQYIFWGESNISWYAYNLISGKYCELDNPSGREIEIFSSLECLVNKLLSESLK